MFSMYLLLSAAQESLTYALAMINGKNFLSLNAYYTILASNMAGNGRGG